MIDVHYASLTSQGVQHRVFYLDGHPSRYQPRPTGLNFGEQTGTGVFPLVIAVPSRVLAIKENDLRTKTAFGDSGDFYNPNRGYPKSYFIQPDFIAKVVGFRATSMDFSNQLAELHVKSPVISLDKSSHLVNSLFKSLLTSPDNSGQRSSSHFTARENSSHPSILLFTALGKSLVTCCFTRQGTLTF